MFKLLLTAAIISIGAGPASPASRISGGQDTTIENHAYQVEIEWNGDHLCGGALLTPSKVVTTAHCIDGTKPSELQVRAGSSFISDGVAAPVSSYANHPSFDGQVDYDVAVLELSKPYTLGPSIRTIPLQGKGEEIAPGTWCTITGWGAVSQSGSLAVNLQEAKIPKIPDNYCSWLYGALFKEDRMTCHGTQQMVQDACEGDFGGPLVLNGALVGLASWSQGCARPEFPGVYTKISSEEIHDFITDQLK